MVIPMKMFVLNVKNMAKYIVVIIVFGLIIGVVLVKKRLMNFPKILTRRILGASIAIMIKFAQNVIQNSQKLNLILMIFQVANPYHPIINALTVVLKFIKNASISL